MLVDANLLIYAVDKTSPDHARAAGWLEAQLNGDRPVGIPWQSLTAFVRIATHPRASLHPLRPEIAWGFVTDWLAAPVAWVPGPTERHAELMGLLLTRYRVAGNLVTDVHLAAIALEHGLTICSADTDFARFTEVRWLNPIADARPG